MCLDTREGKIWYPLKVVKLTIRVLEVYIYSSDERLIHAADTWDKIDGLKANLT